MKTALAFFNDIYEQMNVEVEEKIKKRKENELKLRFEKDGKKYEEELFEEEVHYNSKTGITSRKTVSKGKKITSEFKIAWQNFYVNNKKSINESDDDFKNLQH